MYIQTTTMKLLYSLLIVFCIKKCFSQSTITPSLGPIVFLPPETPVTVSVITVDGQNKFTFNGILPSEILTFQVTIGRYEFLNVSSDHPLIFHSYPDKNSVEYHSAATGNDFILDVHAPFNQLGYMCETHPDTMHYENKFSFVESTTTTTTTTTQSTTTLTTLTTTTTTTTTMKQYKVNDYDITEKKLQMSNIEDFKVGDFLILDGVSRKITKIEIIGVQSITNIASTIFPLTSSVVTTSTLEQTTTQLIIDNDVYIDDPLSELLLGIVTIEKKFPNTPASDSFFVFHKISTIVPTPPKQASSGLSPVVIGAIAGSSVAGVLIVGMICVNAKKDSRKHHYHKTTKLVSPESLGFF